MRAATSAEGEHQRPARERLEPRVGRGPEQCPAARPREAARLKRHGPLLDLGDGAEDHRPDDRHDPPHAADAAFGVETAGPLGHRDLAGSLDHGRHGLHGGVGHERDPRAYAPALEVDDQVAWMGRQVEERDRSGDGHEAGQDLEGEDRPSTVAVIGPIRSSTVSPPGKKKG